jgi:hypothetical protein
MNRIHLPLLPLPVLAVLVAVSACSKPRTEETTHVIPPAVSILAPAAQAQTPAQEMVAARADDKPADDDKPSAEEVKEFERPVRK